VGDAAESYTTPSPLSLNRHAWKVICRKSSAESHLPKVTCRKSPAERQRRAVFLETAFLLTDFLAVTFLVAFLGAGVLTAIAFFTEALGFATFFVVTALGAGGVTVGRADIDFLAARRCLASCSAITLARSVISFFRAMQASSQATT